MVVESALVVRTSFTELCFLVTDFAGLPVSAFQPAATGGLKFKVPPWRLAPSGAQDDQERRNGTIKHK